MGKYAVGWSGDLGNNDAVKANQNHYNIEKKSTVCAEDNLLACKKGFVFSIAYHLNIRDLQAKRACGESYEKDGAWVRGNCQKLLYEKGIKDIFKDLYP